MDYESSSEGFDPKHISHSSESKHNRSSFDGDDPSSGWSSDDNKPVPQPVKQQAPKTQKKRKFDQFAENDNEMVTLVPKGKVKDTPQPNKKRKVDDDGDQMITIVADPKKQKTDKNASVKTPGGKSTNIFKSRKSAESSA